MVACPFAALAVLLFPAAAQADLGRVPSSNWAGYAVHRRGISFRFATATWQISTAMCVAGQPTFSATWVGIGGYSLRSRALEQIGTETNCGAHGRILTRAWYELLPAAAHAIHLLVRPGDRVRASVKITGRVVVLWLDNLTTHRRFHRKLHTAAIDTGSAEWIEEAPSACATGGGCRILPLADFEQVHFSQVSATAASGRRGGIRGGDWAHTAIYMTDGGPVFVARSSIVLAAPSPLGGPGRAFTITYRAPAPSSALARRRWSRLRARTRQRHPGDLPSAAVRRP
jgi:hypothetical protein